MRLLLQITSTLLIGLAAFASPALLYTWIEQQSAIIRYNLTGKFDCSSLRFNYFEVPEGISCWRFGHFTTHITPIAQEMGQSLFGGIVVALILLPIVSAYIYFRNRLHLR